MCKLYTLRIMNLFKQEQLHACTVRRSPVANSKACCESPSVYGSTLPPRRDVLPSTGSAPSAFASEGNSAPLPSMPGAAESNEETSEAAFSELQPVQSAGYC